MAIRILTIDDEPSQLTFFSALLERAFPDAEQLEADSGEAGLRLAASHQPDLILLDAKMPELDGFEVCRRLKADERTRFIPVLMVSGKLMESRHRVTALEIGADGYICKPFDRIELTAQIKALLRIKQDEDRLREHEQQLERLLEQRTAALRESEQRFRLMADSAPVMIWMGNPDGACEYVNRQWSEFSGRRIEQETGNGWMQTIHPEDRQLMLDLLARVKTTRREEALDCRMKRADGEYRWMLYRVAPQPADTNNRAGLIASCVDITRRKLSEGELNRLASAVEQSAESILITDTAGHIVYVNPGFEQITGFTKKEVLGKTPRILKSGKHNSAYYSEMWETLLRGETWTGRFLNMRKDGSFYEIEQTISPIRDSNGKLVNFVSVAQDLTREIQLEAEFRQAQKLESVGRLAGGVAHDFNNLLTTILGFGELLRTHIREDNELRGDLEEIIHAAERATGLTRQLLAFGRKHTAYMAPLNLNLVVQDTDKLLRRTLGEDIELITLLGDDLWTIESDVGLIEQVLMNLCVNARDAMPEGGKLTIHTENTILDRAFCRKHVGIEPGEYVRIRIHDTGCGIPEDIREHIFEPFFTTKPKSKGTGLGLSTVYGIVKQCRGHIFLEDSSGEGTTFSIYFPRLHEPGEPPQSMRKTPSQLSGGHETILLVEDEDTVRRLTARLLTSLGYQVIEARHGENGLRIAEQYEKPIDLVLSDIIMPQLNGPDMVREILKVRPNIKVLYMSGFTESHVLEKISDSAAPALISKPFTRRDLAGKIREVLDE